MSLIYLELSADTQHFIEDQVVRILTALVPPPKLLTCEACTGSGFGPPTTVAGIATTVLCGHCKGQGKVRE